MIYLAISLAPSGCLMTLIIHTISRERTVTGYNQNNPRNGLMKLSLPFVTSTFFLTGGIYAFYWFWLQSREEKTLTDTTIKKCVNFGLILIGIYLFICLLMSGFWLNLSHANSLSLFVIPFLVVLFVMAYMALAAAAVLIALKVNLLGTEQIGIARTIALSALWFMCIFKLQKHINQLNI
jgi:hypothetical protein